MRPDPVFSEVIDTLLCTGARSAVKYVTPQLVVKATLRHKPDRRSRHWEMVVSAGTPNWTERRTIRCLKKAQEPFPVKKVALKAWPTKR
jgi:hypothetical protein